ncbi:MAG: polymerase subunit sigma-70 [Caulobacteraceae bacterium]|nr:polymerase subunit sigma-70 [Caulobacteraceae bacterium]
MRSVLQTPWRIAGLADLELIGLASGGDRRAFGELARRHGSAVRGLLRRMGAQAALADDLAQDAFILAYQRIAEFRGQGSFVGWVRKIAARLYLRQWRSKVRLEPLSDEEPEEGACGEAGIAWRIDIDAALLHLTAAERLCILLCFSAGFSHGEAALALGAPLGTVKSHVRRGLDKLRARLDETPAVVVNGGRNG